MLAQIDVLVPVDVPAQVDMPPRVDVPLRVDIPAQSDYEAVAKRTRLASARGSVPLAKKPYHYLMMVSAAELPPPQLELGP